MVFKTALRVLGGVIVLPVVLAWAVPPLLDGNSLSPMLQDKLSVLLGHPVRINGSTVVRLLPSPSLTADSVDIFDPGEDEQTPSATVGRVRVDVPLLPLLRGMLNVSTLQLDNLDLRGVPTVRSLTAQRGVTGDIQGKLDVAGLLLDFSARFTPGKQITLTDPYGAVLNFSGSISEHGVELAGPVELTMPAPDRSLAYFGGLLPTQPLKLSAQLTVDQGEVEITNLAGLLGDGAIVGAVEVTSGQDLVVRLSTNGLNMDQWSLVVPDGSPPHPASDSAPLSRLEADIALPALPRVQMSIVNESFTLGGLVWPAARLLLETAEEQLTLKLAEVDIPGGRIQLTGQGTTTGDTYFEGTLTLSTRDRQAFGAWLGREPVDFAMTVPITWMRQGLNLTPMTGRWNNTDLYGGLTLASKKTGQVLVMDVKTPQGDFGLHSTLTLDSDKILNLSDLSAQIGNFTAQGAVQVGWEDGKPRFAAMLVSPPQVAVTPAEEAKGKASGTAAAKEPVSSLDVGDFLSMLVAMVDIPVGNSTIDWQGGRLSLMGGTLLEQPKVRIAWQGDRIILDGLTGRWGGGSLLAKGAIIRDPAAKDGRRLEAYAHVNDGNLSALNLSLGPVTLAGGQFEAEGNLSTEGRTKAAWLAGLGGTLRVDARAGNLRGINLPSLVAAVKSSGLGGLLRMNRKTLLSGITPFRSLTATAIVDGGLVNTDDFSLVMDGGQLTAQSVLDLSKESGNTDVTLNLDGLTPLRFSLNGPLSRPKVIADAHINLQR